MPQEEYEIVVVDNGSTDDTRELVFKEFGQVPIVRYFCEPSLGLSRARNTGWRNARGEYVAFLDDDAIAGRHWLEKILHAFDTTKPCPGCVGGRIRPIWVTPRPPWLSDQIMVYLAILDSSATPMTSWDNPLLAGANMAFPRLLIEAVDGFRQDVGRRGNCAQSITEGDEIYVIRKIMRLGYSCHYDPEIDVSHHIQPAKLTRRWFASRMRGEGLGEAFLRLDLEHPSWIVWLRVLLFTILGLGFNSICWFFLLDQQKRFTRESFVQIEIGRIIGLWRYRHLLRHAGIADQE